MFLSGMFLSLIGTSDRNPKQAFDSLELYGEPLTDDDIAERARVTFQMLDEEEKRAQTR